MSGQELTVHVEADPLRGDELRVVRVQGTERISEMFDLSVEAVVLVEGFEVETLLLAPINLVYMFEGEEVHRLAGVVAEVDDRIDEHSLEPRVALRFVPRAYAAAMRETLDIFMDVSVPDVLERCLTRSGLASGSDFAIDQLEGTYPAREFIVQYRETDLAFVSRLCEHLGIFFYFDHASGSDVMVFGDANSAFAEIQRVPELELLSRSGAHHTDRIERVEVKTRSLPQRYVVRDYNYRNPGVDLLAEATVDEQGVGEVVEYGAHFKDPDEGQRIARVRAEELRSRGRVYRGVSTVPNFFAGGTFTMLGHHRGDIELLLIEVEHDYRHATEDADTAESRYRNRFVAIPKEVPYRPSRKTPKPRVHGVVTGVIDAAQKNEYASIDDDGRYRVTFLYDTADRQGGQASRPVRMAQPHSGAGYGMHFPLRPGTEVILTCVDGDPDRPIISGTVPNPQTASPVTGGNHKRNIIRTGGGNEINIDDEAGSERIKLSTPYGSTRIQLGAPNDPNVGVYISTGNDFTSTAKEVYGVHAKYKTMISSFSSVFAEKSEVRFVGNLRPWDYADRISAAAQKAADLAKAPLSVLKAGVKDYTASQESVAQEREEELKAQKSAYLQPETYDRDTAPKVQKYDAASDRITERPETEDEWRERRTEERLDEDRRRSRDAARTGDVDGARRIDARTDAVTSAQRARSRSEAEAKDAKEAGEVVTKAADKAAEIIDGYAKVVEKGAALWGDLKKNHQKSDSEIATGLAKVYGSLSGAVLGTHSVSPRPIAKPYIIDVAMNTSAFVAKKGVHLMAGSVANVYAKDTAIHAKRRVHVGSMSIASVTSKKVYTTAAVLVDVTSGNRITMKSTGDSAWTAHKKMTLRATQDLLVSSDDADINIYAQKKIDILARDDGKARAKQWTVKSTDGFVKIESSKRFELSAKDGFSLEGKSKSIIKGDGSQLELKHASTKAVLSSSELALSTGSSKVQLGSGSLEIKSGSVTIKGSGTAKLDGSKVLIG